MNPLRIILAQSCFASDSRCLCPAKPNASQGNRKDIGLLHFHFIHFFPFVGDGIAPFGPSEFPVGILAFLSAPKSITARVPTITHPFFVRKPAEIFSADVGGSLSRPVP